MEKCPSKRSCVSCFLCGKRCEQDVHSENSNSFRILLRYLGIEVSKLSKQTSSLAGGDVTGNGANVKVNLCELCSSRLREFFELYENFEEVRLSLDKCFQLLYEVMKEDSYMEGFGGSTSFMEVLKAETLKKSALKIAASIPRVKLDTISSTFIKIEHSVKVEQLYDENDDENEDFADSPSSGNVNPLVDVSENSEDVQATVKLLDPSDFAFSDNPNPNQDALPSSNQEEIASKNAYNCQNCKKSFNKKHLLKSHMIRFHLMLLYSSSIPSGTTLTQLQLATLKVFGKHKKHQDKYSCCPCCTAKFLHPYLLKEHIQNKHFDVVLLALKKDDSMEALVEPLKVTRVKVPSTLKTYGKSALARTQIFKCQHCDEAFVDSTKHINHERAHIEARHCFTCEKTYPTPSQLVRHQKAKHIMLLLKDKIPPDTSEPEVEQCIQSFMAKAKVRLNNSCEYLSCPFCKSSSPYSPSKSALRSHLVSNHLPNIIEDLIKAKWISFSSISTYDCPYCDKSYTSQTAQRVHSLKTHTFLCFRSRLPEGTTEESLEAAMEAVIGSVKTRMENEKKNVVYECGVDDCDKAFAMKGEYKRHLITMHFNLVVEQLNSREVIILS